MYLFYMLSLFLCTVSFSLVAQAELTLYQNGKITTLDEANPQADAMVVENDRIVFVGTKNNATPYLKTRHKTVDLHQRRVLPGFIESHAHFLGIGLEKLNLDLKNTTSPEEIVTIVQKTLKDLPNGAWLMGRGWDQNKWATKTFPNHAGLSAISANNPVVLRRIDGHALWCNEAAMKIAGVNKDTKDPDGGKILRDSHGNPTGVFVDAAAQLILSHYPLPSDELTLKAVQLAQSEASQFGVTSLHDAGIRDQDIRIFEKLASSHKLNVRINAMLDGSDQSLLDRYFAKGPQISLYNNHLIIRTIKLYADGALGSRGAALLAPYSDEPNNSGLILTDKKRIAEVSRAALAHGFQVATHAIGDRANRFVLDAYQSATDKIDVLRAARFRIEHAQIVSPIDLPRFATLGIIASMQPTHCTSDAPWVPARLGDARSKSSAYMWRNFLNAKVPLAFGSDAPVESLDPIKGLYAAVTRLGENDAPSAKPFYPEQALTLMEALRAFTIGGAYAEFAESQKGQLKKGYLADFIILDKDIMKLPTRELLSTHVQQTFVGGQSVYESRSHVSK